MEDKIIFQEIHFRRIHYFVIMLKLKKKCSPQIVVLLNDYQTHLISYTFMIYDKYNTIELTMNNDDWR